MKQKKTKDKKSFILFFLVFLFLLGLRDLNAEPFGFIGIRSSLKDTYLENLGVEFIRGNLLFWDIYSISEDKWNFKNQDNLFSGVYARNADLIVTFMSPRNMDKIRANYYRDFILRSVERYDGDTDYGCTQSVPDCYEPQDNMYPAWDVSKMPVIKFWQIENEVDEDPYWSEHPADYAELVNLVYPLVKSACPECSVLLGSFLLYDLKDGFYDSLFLNTNKFDIVDFHWFGGMNKDHFKSFSKRIDFMKNCCPSLPIWVTETSTYTDSPRSADGTYRPYQSELAQAIDLFKRYVHFTWLGVKKVLWNFLYEATDGKENGVFWYTGLIYDGKGEFDKGEGIKKLSYFTYKLMVEKLDGADWENITSTIVEDNVYQYLFMKSGIPLYVVWYDWFNGEYSSRQVKLDVSAISTSLAKVTGVVPKFQTGKEADAVPFDEAFTSYTVPVIDGTIRITLGKRPIFIEEDETY